MASVVEPFNATYYNPAIAKNYSEVVCPPYDVISKEQLSVLRKKSPYNFSKVLIADDNDYKKAASTLNEWVSKKVLIDDKEKCLYLYEQKFFVEGKKVTRFGIIGLLQMNKKGIFPHEYTLKGPKEDRKKIIRSTKANLSPIFVIAAKRLKLFKDVYGAYRCRKPFARFKDQQCNPSRVWRIEGKTQIGKIQKEIDKCKLIIADGHHRFEISYDYFNMNKGKFKDLNYILAYITDFQKGLNILPTHRVLKLKDSLEQILEKLKDSFIIKDLKQSVIEKKLKQKGKFSFGIYRNKKFYFLELKKLSILNKISKKIYKDLDTYVFHQLILPLFESNGIIEYTHSVSEAKKIAGAKKTAFLLKAVTLDSVLKLSCRGFRLPQKSTYFYPKILSGVTIRRFRR